MNFAPAPFSAARLGAVPLGAVAQARPRLGDPGAIHVAVFDENGRPFPNIELAVVLPGPSTAPEVRSVGATGETTIDVRTLPAGEKVILTPNIPPQFVSDPPYHEIEPGVDMPAEVDFVVAMRHPEKDYVTPIITFVSGGVLTGILLWGLDRLGVKL